MKRLLFPLSLLFLLLILFSPAGLSQEEGWSQPLRLGDGWFPDIVADASGQLHLVYGSALGDSANFAGYDVVMYTTSADGVKWSTPIDIGVRPQNSGSEVTRPYLITDRANNLHMTYRDTTVFYAQVPIPLAAQAGNWSLKVISQGYFSVIGIDSPGRYHLAYTDNVVTDQCPICYHLFYTYSDNSGQSWSSPTDVSSLPTGSAKPQMIIDEQDNLYLFWEAGTGGSYGQLVDPTIVLFSFSSDHGVTWSLPSQLYGKIEPYNRDQTTVSIARSDTRSPTLHHDIFRTVDRPRTMGSGFFRRSYLSAQIKRMYAYNSALLFYTGAMTANPHIVSGFYHTQK